MIFENRAPLALLDGTADEPIGLVWNPHASMSVRILRLGYQYQSGSAGGTVFRQITCNRASARGTPTSSTTAGAPQEAEGAIASIAGVVIDDCATATPPTWLTPPLYGWTLTPGPATSIWMPMDDGLWLPPGTGVGFISLTGLAVSVSYILVTWEE